MSDIDPESLEIFNQFLARRNRNIEEKQRLHRQRLEDRKRDWATASTVRLTPVQGIDVNLDVARLCIDSAGRLVAATTPGETRNHSPDWWRRAALGLETVTEIDYSLLDVEVRDDAGTVDRFRLRDIPTSGTRAETLPDGGFVVTSSRTGFHDSAWAHNVWIVDADGAPRQSFSAGDAISQVGVTASGRIWTGYFDQGTVGSGLMLGRSGLVCWSQDGELLYEFEAPEGCEPIFDCYSMSLNGEDAWTCYMDGFPVVHVNSAFESEGWPLGVRRATAIAAGHGRAAVADFNDGDVGAWIVDTSGESRDPTAVRLTMPDGSELPDKKRLFGRGRYLNVATQDQWLRIDVDDLPST